MAEDQKPGASQVPTPGTVPSAWLAPCASTCVAKHARPVKHIFKFNESVIYHALKGKNHFFALKTPSLVSLVSRCRAFTGQNLSRSRPLLQKLWS